MTQTPYSFANKGEKVITRIEGIRELNDGTFNVVKWKGEVMSIMDAVAKAEVEAFKKATPERTGQTKKHWYARKNPNSVTIHNTWRNDRGEYVASYLAAGTKAHIIGAEPNRGDRTVLSNWVQRQSRRGKSLKPFFSRGPVEHPGTVAIPGLVNLLDGRAGEIAGEIASKRVINYYQKTTRSAPQFRSAGGLFGGRVF